MKDLLKYAQRRLDEACAGVEGTCSIRYWVGYIDGVKRATEKAETMAEQLTASEVVRCDLGKRVAALEADNARLNQAYAAIGRDLAERTKQLCRCRNELEMARGERDAVTKRMIELEQERQVLLNRLARM